MVVGVVLLFTSSIIVIVMIISSCLVAISIITYVIPISIYIVVLILVIIAIISIIFGLPRPPRAAIPSQTGPVSVSLSVLACSHGPGDAPGGGPVTAGAPGKLGGGSAARHWLLPRDRAQCGSKKNAAGESPCDPGLPTRHGLSDSAETPSPGIPLHLLIDGPALCER
eukprot:575511-Hanusia_phi.AAC.1